MVLSNLQASQLWVLERHTIKKFKEMNFNEKKNLD